jgi:hypothetical protein
MYHQTNKESTTQLKINDIISYFDEGGNLIIIGDIDTDKSYRRLFQAFGLELDEYVPHPLSKGSKLKDYFNNHQTPSILKTSNYVTTPFLNLTKPLLYQGLGLNLANYVNYQLYELLSSEPTTLSRNYISE